jgi:hypothetical protein
MLKMADQDVPRVWEQYSELIRATLRPSTLEETVPRMREIRKRHSAAPATVEGDQVGDGAWLRDGMKFNVMGLWPILSPPLSGPHPMWQVSDKDYYCVRLYAHHSERKQ